MADSRSVLLAFYAADQGERVKEQAVRIGIALSPESDPPVVRLAAGFLVVEATRTFRQEEDSWRTVRERLEYQTPALAEPLRGARLVAYAYCDVAPLPPLDGLPRTVLPEGEVIDLAPDLAPGERLLILGPTPDRALDRVRPLLARVASARRRLDAARTYLVEITKGREVIDHSVSRVLRHRIGQAKPAEAIKVLEDELHEMSQNFATLTRNAGIIDGALADVRTDVQMLEREVETLPRVASPPCDDTFARLSLPLRLEVTELEREERLLHESLDAARTAMEIHRMNVEIVRSGELLGLQQSTEELQKRAVSFQSAAMLIELVIVFAYTLHSWELLAQENFKRIYPAFTFFATLVFAVLLVLSAHEIAHRIREGRFAKKGYVLLGGLILLVLLMAFCAPLRAAERSLHVYNSATERHSPRTVPGARTGIGGSGARADAVRHAPGYLSGREALDKTSFAKISVLGRSCARGLARRFGSVKKDAAGAFVHLLRLKISLETGRPNHSQEYLKS